MFLTKTTGIRVPPRQVLFVFVQQFRPPVYNCHSFEVDHGKRSSVWRSVVVFLYCITFSFIMQCLCNKMVNVADSFAGGRICRSGVDDLIHKGSLQAAAHLDYFNQLIRVFLDSWLVNSQCALFRLEQNLQPKWPFVEEITQPWPRWTEYSPCSMANAHVHTHQKYEL